MDVNFSTAAAIAFLATTFDSLAQAPLPHSFAGITVLSDGTTSLTLTGRVASALRPYFDIYPLDASSDLVTWQPLATLIRSNASTEALTYSDPEAAHFPSRFYRTFKSQFVTPLAKPAGPYAVGRVYRLVTDLSRTNRYNISTNSSFMVTITYPAESTAGAVPDRYVERALAVFAYAANDAPDTFGQLFAFSILNAPMRTNEAPYPVVIYSHGYSSTRALNTEKAEELASHGYIVAAMDHIDCYASIFPNGKVVPGIYSAGGYTEAIGLRVLPDRVKDVRFVLDELTRLNRDDPLFVGRLDLARAGVMGHSAGGGTAAEAARVDERLKAGVFFDESLLGAVELRQAGLQKPFLIMHSEGWPDNPLFSLASADAYWCQVSNAVHATFTDSWPADRANAISRRDSEAIRACMLSFFDKYLKERDDHLLDNPTNRFPVIYNYQKK